MIEKISSETLQEKAYRAIRDSIVRNALLPNEAISIDALAKILGISATPVREALARLSADGLVQLNAHRPPRVSDISEDDVREVYEVRRLLEPYVVRIVVDFVSRDPDLRWALGKLRREAERARELATQPIRDPTAVRDAVVKTDLDLQDLMERALGETLLGKSLSFVGSHALRIRGFAETVAGEEDPSISQAITEDHCRILDALWSGSPDEASTAVLSHLDSAEKRTLDAAKKWHVNSREERSESR
jgi:DNA-binding GntR family transcriptional regulator